MSHGGHHGQLQDLQVSQVQDQPGPRWTQTGGLLSEGGVPSEIPGEESLTSEINQICNVLSSLKFLQSYTSHLTQPTPAIINNLLSSCLRLNQSSLVVERILHYLEISLYRFLSCVSSGVITYRAWLEIILSACRTGPNIDYNSFNLDNKQDTAACLAFFKLILNEFSSDQAGSEGAVLLVEFLVRLCQKDLQLWWRKHRRDGCPVLYYLLGDSTTSLVPNMKKLVSPVYRSLLEAPYSHKLGLVRRLISQVSIILSHLDEDNRQSYINSGTKLELAGVVAGVLLHCQASLWSELSLLQPDWFSLLVSRQLLSLLTGRPRSQGSSLTDLTTALGRLSVEERGGSVGRCVDILHYRAVSSCHLHTCLRTLWQTLDSTEKSGTVFTMMNRLERTQEKTYYDKSKTKIVRFRSGVTFKMSNIIEDINQLAGFVNASERVASVHEHLPSLLFKMTSPKSF